MDAQEKKKNDPNTYKHTPAEKFTINRDLEDIFYNWKDDHELVGLENTPGFADGQRNQDQQDEFLLKLVKCQPSNEAELNSAILTIRRKNPANTKKSSLLRALNRLLALQDSRLDVHQALKVKPLLVKKQSKSQSGVLVITVLTSPYPKLEDGSKQTFTCAFDCHYCPNEPGQPRSYLHDEPSVLRANRNEFDAVLQFFDRTATLTANGHPADKIELLILGGTWHSYPEQYRLEFIRDLFYAANVFAPSLEQSQLNLSRKRGSLEEEKLWNETTGGCKIIGITIETRPDCITQQAIVELRQLGVTRVQLGIQHTNNEVLLKVNRGHTIEDAKRGLKLLKDNCYKVDGHWMPNLPGSSPEIDAAMLSQALHDPDLACDQWKIYPTEVTPWTRIEKWFQEGSYLPYGEESLLDVLIGCKADVFPWIRLNRVIRDIPSQYILGGVNAPSMRNSVQTEMVQRGLCCNCIRCREVGGEDPVLSKKSSQKELEPPQLVVRRYVACRAEEAFISMENKDALFGFCRLRFPNESDNEAAFEELAHCALVRELHVYGQLKATENALVQGEGRGSRTQHVGHGSKLMAKAEDLARRRGFRNVAVIAGVGSRGFYRKIGYTLHPGRGEMMIKSLKKEEEVVLKSMWQPNKKKWWFVLFSLCCLWWSSWRTAMH